LVNSDNFQALNIFQEKLYEKINTVHIDPPYNTNTSGFLYKNSFQSSSWLSFMYDRIAMSKSLLNDQGSFVCHIDENEYERLFLMSKDLGLINSGTIIWDKRNPMTGGAGIATQHEYILWQNKTTQTISLNSGNTKLILNKVSSLRTKYETICDESKKEFVEWLNNQEGFSGGELAYRYIDENWSVFQSVSLRAPEKREHEKFFQPLIHPISKKPCAVPPNGFSRTPETLNEMINKGLILYGSDETTQPRQKMILKEDKRQQMTSVIQDATRGKADLDKLNLNFPYNHSVQFYKLLLEGAVDEQNKYILDYFAGSGTTGHATISLNRTDNKNRMYILVEMGTYFNTVTKPRIQKVIYSDNWKNGKPQDKGGISQIVKYQVLESYEDTLNNLFLESKTELDFSGKAKEEYLLQYMLEMESREHLFNLEMFRKPFDYQLKVTENNELKATKVDLVETFNYLIGLYVTKVQRVKDIKVVEGVTRTGIKTLVIWRDMETTTHDEVEKLLRRFYDSQRTKEFQQIYINGDHHLENLRSEGDSFKIKLIEETFFKKMFNETEL
jgi:adenine-specific DNA-methyltransferase